MSIAPSRHRPSARFSLAATLAAGALALTACGGSDAPAAGSASGSSTTSAAASGSAGTSSSASSSASTSESGAASTSAASSSATAQATTASSVSEADRVDPTKTTEAAELTPRVLLSSEDGLTLLDAETGKVVHEQALPGFKRLANAGNGKDVFVTTGNGWETYSTGIKSQAHGDHAHLYTSAPGMTGVTFPGDHPGHVVTHHGLTTLFADGTGAISTFVSDHLDKAVPDLTPVTEESKTTAPHHGVAIELADGSLLTTQGTEESRNTVQVLDRESGKVLAETTGCPGVHGEAAAAPHDGKDVVVLGCENGPVVYRDGAFHKVKVSEAFHRNGNLAGLESSPIVLGDRKVEAKVPEGQVERPTSVVLIDSRTDEMRTVELDSSYWFRSLGRSADGDAVVLTEDGDVTVIDEDTGKITAEIPAIAAWKEKAKWQEPAPILKVAGHTAYVTDAENKKLVIVDLEAGKVERTVGLEFAPVEMAVTTGVPESSATAAEAEAHDHAGEGHDH